MNEVMKMLQEVQNRGRRDNTPSSVRSIHDECSSNSDKEYHPRHRPPRKQDDDGDLRLELLEFDGGMKLEKFLEWMQRIEKVFDYKYFSRLSKEVQSGRLETHGVCKLVV